MLSYNEATAGTLIVLDGQPYEVLAHHVHRKQQNKPVNQTKVRHLKTGKVMERVFHVSDSVEEAQVDSRPIVFIYQNRGEYWFHEEGSPGKRFSLPSDLLRDKGKFLKEKQTIEALVFGEEIIGVKVPVKVELSVKEAPPAVKGNTAQGATKTIVLETGAEIQAPLFINTGDVVRINTENGTYAERAEKK